MDLPGGRLSLPAGEERKGRETIATFITKVWKIVEKAEYNKYIHWSENGKTFVVRDYPNFAKEVLPLYFKHNNFSSFVRQLNLYGFRKVSHPEQGVLAAKGQGDEDLEFWHTNFRRGHPELLHLVQRKSHSSQTTTVKHEAKVHKLVAETGDDEIKPTITKVLGDVQLMQGRQENLMLVIEALKQDNIHLHRELRQMREKSVRQQKVLNKIIQFLVHMVYKGKLPGRRNAVNQLMLMDPNSIEAPPPAKRMRPLTNEVSEFDSDDTPVEFLLDMSPTVNVLTPDSVEIEQFTSSPPTISTAPIIESPVKSASSTTSSASFNLPTLPTTHTSIPLSTTPTNIPPSTTLTNIPPSTTLTSITPSTFSSIMPSASLPSFTASLPTTAPPLLSAAAILSPTSTPTLHTPSTNLTNTPKPSLSGDSYAVVPFEGGAPNVDGVLQLPVISADLLSEFPIHGVPTSLVSNPHPENRMCLNGQLNHQQDGIDALSDVLSGNLNVDPALIAEFLSSEDNPAPNYDYVDTARLLESLMNMNHDTVTDEGTLYQHLQQGTLPPVTPSQPIDVDSEASELEKLLTD